MKINFIFLFLLLSMLSCTTSVDQKEVDEKFEPNQEELYMQCSELKGIDDFIIGKTTFKQALNAPIYAAEIGLLRNNFFNGYWGVGKKGGNHDDARWLEEQAKIKQLTPMLLGDKKIGHVLFSNFDLAFYNDTLAAIYFITDDNKLKQHYIEKYGEGRGSHYWYYYNNHKDANKFRVKEIAKEERVWENEWIMLEFHQDYFFENIPTPTANYLNSSWYLMSSKKLYPKFIDELNNQILNYEHEKTENERKDYEKF